MIDQLIDDLKRDEGWRAEPYQDSLGFWTIGYGFLIDSRKRVRLPKVVGDFWLTDLADRRFSQLLELEPWIADQPEDVQRALGNMAYQLGVTGVRRFRNMLQALKDGDRARAADEALDSRWAKQTPNRAKRISDLIRGG